MERQRPSTDTSTYWCNFCGLKTADQEFYLAHSCTEELRRQGKTPSADPPQTHCR